jgi:hypothetical protein
MLILALLCWHLFILQDCDGGSQSLHVRLSSKTLATFQVLPDIGAIQ